MANSNSTVWIPVCIGGVLLVLIALMAYSRNCSTDPVQLAKTRDSNDDQRNYPAITPASDKLLKDVNKVNGRDVTEMVNDTGFSNASTGKNAGFANARDFLELNYRRSVTENCGSGPSLLGPDIVPGKTGAKYNLQIASILQNYQNRRESQFLKQMGGGRGNTKSYDVSLGQPATAMNEDQITSVTLNKN